MKLAIVSTILEPRSVVENWLNLHIDNGIDKIYLFIDEPKGSYQWIHDNYQPIVEAFYKDQELEILWSQLSEILPEHYSERHSYIVGRQVLNTKIALNRALIDGIDWLVHIDADEVFSPNELRRSLTGLDPCYGQYVMPVYEAVADDVELKGSLFSSARYFKVNPKFIDFFHLCESFNFDQRRWFFLGHTRGKSAIKVHSSVLPVDTHQVISADPWPSTWMGGRDGAILKHYINCSFEQYFRKYEKYGDFPDSYLTGQPLDPFHLESRDVFKKGTRLEFQDFFRKIVVYDDQNEIQNLIAKGLLIDQNSL
jgi:hypothetical protein